jgi:hypothetical protein
VAPALAWPRECGSSGVFATCARGTKRKELHRRTVQGQTTSGERQGCPRSSNRGHRTRATSLCSPARYPRRHGRDQSRPPPEKAELVWSMLDHAAKHPHALEPHHRPTSADDSAMCPSDDSAESRGMPDVPTGAVTPTSRDTTCAGDDSAESREASNVPVACTGGNHVRSSGGTSMATGRPLLERLLDEGEAPGGVEPEMIAGLAVTSSPEPTRP